MPRRSAPPRVEWLSHRRGLSPRSSGRRRLGPLFARGRRLGRGRRRGRPTRRAGPSAAPEPLARLPLLTWGPWYVPQGPKSRRSDARRAALDAGTRGGLGKPQPAAGPGSDPLACPCTPSQTITNVCTLSARSERRPLATLFHIPRCRPKHPEDLSPERLLGPPPRAGTPPRGPAHRGPVSVTPRSGLGLRPPPAFSPPHPLFGLQPTL